MDFKHMLIKSWLKQADEDLKAGRTKAPDISECHRRYWLQQACEKAIKALGIILWSDDVNDKNFKHGFLYKHSPLKNLVEVYESKKLSKSLFGLLRQITVEVNKIEGKDLIWKVDATTPTTDFSDVSYRYPFFDKKGNIIAPADYKDWDSYQGNAIGVVVTLERLLKTIHNRLKADRYPR